MFWLGFGIYTLFLVLIFGFFIVAKIHVSKFRHYSEHIELVTKILAGLLIILSLIGYYFLFSIDFEKETTSTVEEMTNTEIY